MSDGQKKIERRRVLIVSYHFPPDAEVGGLRAEKFAKYLPCFGWAPVVLTVREEYHDRKDANRGRDTNCEVVRTLMLGSPRGAYVKIKSLTRGVMSKLSIKKNKDCNPAGDGALELKERSISKLKRNLLSLLWLPDDRTGWIYPAVKRALKMIKDDEIQTVMTTSPPHSVQLIGLIVKKILRKRWVADFRDPWSLPFQGEQDLYARINRWLERKVMENADLVIVATEVVRKGYAAAYEGRQVDKFICIPNGYDLEDFKAVKLSQKAKTDKLTISYLGEFYIGRTPDAFLRALSDLVKGGLIPAHKLLIRFIGKVHRIGKKSLGALVAELRLSSVTEIIEPVPYYRAIDYMVNSDVLLVFSPQPFYQPTKVFEYIGAGAWVIAFTPPGALADLVRQYPKGMVVDYNDVEGAKEALMVCYKSFAEGKAKDPKNDTGLIELLSRYDRKNLTGELAKHL